MEKERCLVRADGDGAGSAAGTQWRSGGTRHGRQVLDLHGPESLQEESEIEPRGE